MRLDGLLFGGERGGGVGRFDEFARVGRGEHAGRGLALDAVAAVLDVAAPDLGGGVGEGVAGGARGEVGVHVGGHRVGGAVGLAHGEAVTGDAGGDRRAVARVAGEEADGAVGALAAGVAFGEDAPGGSDGVEKTKVMAGGEVKVLVGVDGAPDLHGGAGVELHAQVVEDGVVKKFGVADLEGLGGVGGGGADAGDGGGGGGEQAHDAALDGLAGERVEGVGGVVAADDAVEGVGAATDVEADGGRVHGAGRGGAGGEEVADALRVDADGQAGEGGGVEALVGAEAGGEFGGAVFEGGFGGVLGLDADDVGPVQAGFGGRVAQEHAGDDADGDRDHGDEHERGAAWRTGEAARGRADATGGETGGIHGRRGTVGGEGGAWFSRAG